MNPLQNTQFQTELNQNLWKSINPLSINPLHSQKKKVQCIKHGKRIEFTWPGMGGR